MKTDMRSRGSKHRAIEGVRPSETLVTLTDAALRLRDRVLFRGTCWKIATGEHWAVVGANGAGKSTLVRALTGEVPVVQGAIDPADPLRLRQQSAMVSFEKQRDMLAREDRRQEARYFSREWDADARVRDLLQVPGSKCPRTGGDAAFRFRLAHLSDRSIRDLSSGEIRRLQIALALATSPRLLILDEPFEALDAESQNELADLIRRLMDRERSVMLVTHRRREILPAITHIMGVKDGHVAFQGPREEALKPELLDALYAAPPPDFRAAPEAAPQDSLTREDRAGALIELQNIRVAYGRAAVFENLCWTVHPGEHWALCGPNGSGKTTLLRLIIGEHPQAYGNAVRVFGKRRGAGSSIRELQEQIGFVSSELQIRYRKDVTALEAVLSGFYFSVGLYHRPGSRQRGAADRWMGFLGIGHLAGRPFNHLSHGEQRMVLLARAMVTCPRLLVLDEPCLGLDRANRRIILETVDRITRSASTTVLYISHDPAEIPACITRRLTLVRAGAGPSRAVSSAV